MKTDEGFLARWSRKKADAGQSPELDVSIPSIPTHDQPSLADQPSLLNVPLSTQVLLSTEVLHVPSPVANLPPLTHENNDEIALADLPKIEDIDTDTDLKPWLGRNVPDSWRLAALRKVWSCDASIAGFIGPSDYAWDWNVEDGVPGFGPLRALDNVAQLLAQATGGVWQTPDQIASDADIKREQAAQIDASFAKTKHDVVGQDAYLDQPFEKSDQDDRALIINEETSDDTFVPVSTRRSGGALPI